MHRHGRGGEIEVLLKGEPVAVILRTSAWRRLGAEISLLIPSSEGDTRRGRGN